MKSYQQLIAVVAVCLTLPFCVLLIINSDAPPVFPPSIDDAFNIDTGDTATVDLPPGVKPVPKGCRNYPPGQTPINSIAFDGALPHVIQQLRSSPPGTKVPLIGFAMDNAPNTVEMATGMPFRPSNFYGGLLTDNTGQVYYPNGQPAGPELGQRIDCSIRQGRAISRATGQVLDMFLHVQTRTSENRDLVWDTAMHGWSDATLGIGHFLYRGEEYEVSSQYTYAVGPDDRFYYAENEGCFNSNFHVLRLF